MAPHAHTIATGFLVGLGPKDGFKFDPAKPYCGCKLCGRIYQNDNVILRWVWTKRHSRQHSDAEHRQLKLSGRWCTPEAAYVLAAYGVFSITDLVLDPEVAHALREAPRAPINDVDF